MTETIKARRDFLAASRGAKAHATGFVLQARAREDADGAVRIGYTCSKKVGNAVARNRAKRRLRAVAREVFPDVGRPGWDYVLIGRQVSTATMPYDTLRDDLRTAIARVHG